MGNETIENLSAKLTRVASPIERAAIARAHASRGRADLAAAELSISRWISTVTPKGSSLETPKNER